MVVNKDGKWANGKIWVRLGFGVEVVTMLIMDNWTQKCDGRDGVGIVGEE